MTDRASGPLSGDLPSLDSDVVRSAAALPLMDAAFEIWLCKQQLDSLDARVLPRPPAPAIDFEDPVTMQRLVREALMKILHDRAHAHQGPTFLRVKHAHPEAPEDAIRSAIRAAVKLRTDCQQAFTYGEDYSADVYSAVRIALEQNPGFGRVTYERLAGALAREMR